MHEAFDIVGVDLGATIRQKGLQTNSLAVDVGQFLTQWRFGQEVMTQ